MRRLWLTFALFVSVVVLGIVGYMVVLGWSFTDAIYMTIITITTVGFREVRSLSVVGQYFTMILALAGTGTAFYLLISITEFMIEGHLTGLLAERRVEREIKKQKEHYILCGFGKVGANVAEELSTSSADFVIIENNHERVESARSYGYYCIEGDASSDEVLIKAGVERAKGLIAAVDNDADNVFVTLTARVLNPGINIVARSILEESREKLIHAGANRVVSPAFIGGRRMASIMLRPLVSDYLDVVTFGDGLQYRLEEYVVSPSSTIKGKSLADADVRQKTGALVLAIKRTTGEFNTNPSPDTTIESGDHIVVLGTQNQLEAVQNII
ncbi:MAG TPA: potassium channel protein [Candidatus Aquicultor sp.]|jgi:voltage-gated potassium channel